jgi:hypothetical protein
MPQKIRLWEVQDGDRLKEIEQSRLNMESRIECWLEQDISILSDDLLVIGRQVATDFGGAIDLLCLDRDGNLVVIELKRDRSPREVTAQVLDYASWAKDLSNDRITELANRYLGERGPLEDAFRKRFLIELPEALNERQKMLIVASEYDASSERIISYLSETYGVAINAVTFQYFCDGHGRELLARVFLIEPDQAEYQVQIKSPSKRKPPLTFEELQSIAERNGVGELYKRLVVGLSAHFDQKGTTRTTATFIGVIDGSRNTILSLVPGASNPNRGMCCHTYIERFCRYFGLERDEAVGLLPVDSSEGEAWKGGPPMYFSFFKDTDEVDRFLAGLGGTSRRAA